MRIQGIEGLSIEELKKQVAGGGRFVFYEYCLSLVVVTFRRPTDVYFVPAGKSGLARGWCYTLVSVLLGWWGVPWGLIYTPLTIVTNLSGGCDVTAEVLSRLGENPQAVTLR
jgi:hypothetical protein